jgi:hypothetical protein
MIKYDNVLTILLFVLFSFSVSAQKPDEAALLKQFHQISEREIYGWVEKMCAPEYKGRLTGTPEFLEVTEWVAGMLKEWGVEPGAPDGSYFQWFDRPWVEVHNQGEINLLLPQKNGKTVYKHYSFPEEAVVGMATGSGDITAEVVFAGYGVTAPELNYDDYKDIDVKGKIVLINRDVPFKDALDPEYSKWVKYCYHIEKLQNAVRHGARGLIYIDGNLANPNIAYDPSIIVFGIGPVVSDDIFFICNKDMKEIFANIDRNIKPASFCTGVKMQLKAFSTYHPEGKGCSVIGKIPGTNPDLKEESVVIGGHLDGVGFIGDNVFSGALDNASGIADILAAAKALGLSGIKPERTIIFIFTGGEEVGLFGAKEYVKNPTLPLEKIVCYINLDMVGNGTGIIIANGNSYPELLECFQDANTEYIHRPFTSSEKRPYYGRPRTDSGPFDEAGVKNMSIYTSGAYKQGFYHLPDDKPETITTQVMEDVAKMLYIGLLRMANK